MERTIVAGADLAGDALADLKSWLGISRPDEDAMLAGLLHASAALCEAFTGQAPLEQVVEERISVSRGRHMLSSRPVRALVAVEVVAQDGSSAPLASSDYDFAIGEAKRATLEVLRAHEGQAIAVRLAVGIAPDWSALPEPLRHGIIRMAAYHYGNRDRGGASGDAPPPASVAALWRPWRSVRLT